MWKNQIVTAWRRLKNNKPYAIINIAGLGASLACAIILYLFIGYHLRFDNFHADSDRIYRISSRTMYGSEDFNEGVPQPLGKALRNDYPYFDDVAMRVTRGRPLITVQSGKDQLKFTARPAFVEPSYFRILNFPIIKGNPETALNEPYSAIITQKTAENFFPGQDPIGKQFRLSNSITFTVRGIAKDMPVNTDHPLDIFLSYSAYKDVNPYMASDSSWGSIASSIQCYVKLKEGISPEQVASVFPQVIKKYNPDQEGMYFVMQPIRDLHFDTRFSGTIQKKYLWSLAWMGAFLVFTACINFINLSTAQSLRRSREIGVRKALGSTRLQIFSQFLSETFLIVAAAVAIAIAGVALALPILNKTLFTEITLDSNNLIMLSVFTILLLAVVMLLAGYYPGIMQAKLNPIKALRSHSAAGGKGRFPLRRTLIIIQFVIMQVMIVGAIVIARQMHYSMNSDKGMEKKGVMLVRIPEQQSSTLQTLRNRITQLAGVADASYCNAAPLSGTNRTTSVRLEGRKENEDFEISLKYVDKNYLSTFGIQLIAGSNLPLSDTANGMLVNETMLRKLQLASTNDIIGKTISINNQNVAVRGVFRDFHTQSFHSDLEPLCMYADISEWDLLAVKIDMQQASTLQPAIEKMWNETFPAYLYRSEFMDDDIAEMYESESMLMQLVEIFALVAVLIGCLGLYGLISFMAVQKKKEIGVRKVLGASVPSVIWMFGREFTLMLITGFLAAVPLSWWLMSSWLRGFHYRIDIGGDIYLITILLCASITALTVGYTSIRAALMNPAVSLKTE